MHDIVLLTIHQELHTKIVPVHQHETLQELIKNRYTHCATATIILCRRAEIKITKNDYSVTKWNFGHLTNLHVVYYFSDADIVLLQR